MTEEKTPEKAPIAPGAPSVSSRPNPSAPESSASYIAAEPNASESVMPVAHRSGSGPGVLVLVILAAVVGGLVSLYFVRESPWLAQKILKEQAQSLDEAGDQAADKTDSPEKAERPATVSASAVSGGAVPSGDRPEQITLSTPRLDPLVSQRIAQMQQWSTRLQTLRAGPRDPSAALDTILSASRSLPSVPAASDRSGKAMPSAAETAPDNGASPQAAPEPPSVDPFGERLGRWFDGALDATGRFLASLVRIQQLDDPDVAGQTQSFFAQIDQRAQSHLLSARLLLMHDQPRLAGEELAALIELLTRYYDASDGRLAGLKDEISALRAALKDPA